MLLLCLSAHARAQVCGVCVCVCTRMQLLPLSLQIGDKYKRGELLTGEVKQRLIDVLVPMVLQHQEARRAVTAETVDLFMSVRPLDF
ncbi:hypothetical protein EON67_00870 [archaeon]|nr:MAG: hypothetical protein EON67_00870 [archaeon]